MLRSASCIASCDSAGVRVPNGFAVTADGYRHFLRASGLEAEIAALVRGLRTTDLAALAACGLAIREAITDAEMPADLQDEIVAAYERARRGRDGRRRGPQQRHRRGSARRKLRGAAGDLSERARPQRPSSTRAADRSRRCSPIARSPTGPTKDSISCRSRCLSASSAWCAPILPPRA